MPHGSVSWLVFTLSCPFPKRSVARQLRQTYSGGPAPEFHRSSHNIDAAQLQTSSSLSVMIQSFFLRVNIPKGDFMGPYPHGQSVRTLVTAAKIRKEVVERA